MTIGPTDQRSALLQLLRRYEPADDGDRLRRDTVQKFVEDNVNCFERSNLAGHVTGSAWLVDKTGQRVLLTHHKKLGKWLQLGGHADGDPDVLAVALKEAREESGLENVRVVSPAIFDIDFHPIPARGKEPAHIHYDVRFALQVKDSEEFVSGNESNKLEWVPIDGMASYSQEDSMLRMARKWALKSRT